MTLPSSIPAALKALQSAHCPEDVFGHSPAGLKAAHREWAKLVHEDKASARQKAAAHEAFLLLTKWLRLAESKIEAGSYGDGRPAVSATFKTKTAAYAVTTMIQAGDIADLYDGESNRGVACIVKVCRSPRNSDLMKAEADLLAKLPAALKPEHTVYFPNLLDSFEVTRDKMNVRVNVFAAQPGFVSLAAVRDAYPDGVDPKDAAWMWNRMLEALHLLHLQGYIHTNVTPDRFLINPDTHVGCLTDFCYAVKNGSAARAISPAWKTFYPEELLAKKSLDFSTDLYEASHCMNYLLGASKTHHVPAGTPVAIAGLLRSCWLGRAHRASSAHKIHADFKVVRKGLGWSSAFRPFALNSV